MKRRPHGHHQFDSVRLTAAKAAAVDHASSEFASAPLDVVQVQFRNQGDIESDLLATLSQPLYVRPALASIPSSATLRNHPPNTGNQYPNRIRLLLRPIWPGP